MSDLRLTQSRYITYASLPLIKYRSYKPHSRIKHFLLPCPAPSWSVREHFAVRRLRTKYYDSDPDPYKAHTHNANIVSFGTHFIRTCLGYYTSSGSLPRRTWHILTPPPKTVSHKPTFPTYNDSRPNAFNISKSITYTRIQVNSEAWNSRQRYFGPGPFWIRNDQRKDSRTLISLNLIDLSAQPL